MKRIAVIVAALIFSGCETYSQVVRLDLPVKPSWPLNTVENFKCVTTEVWFDMEKRSIIRDGYEKELRGKIESTH